ncbi:YciI family protein [Brachybacterium hainanense]|uniref:YciI family protein n=1 Tax=Brachybacterium hainanense TaxID=1541174 RepID=A0ABV6REN0_9MICO
MTSESTGTGSAWAALIHSPGPTASGPLFRDPRFAHHLAFLRSLDEKGWLVAAGSFADADGEGMTVVRCPASVGLDGVERLARADEAVVSGLLSVRIRPWRVVMAGT